METDKTKTKTSAEIAAEIAAEVADKVILDAKIAAETLVSKATKTAKELVQTHNPTKIELMRKISIVSKKWVIWTVTITYIFWGITLIVSNSPTATTGISPLLSLFGNTLITGIIFLSIGLISLAALLKRKNKYTLLMLLSQQLVLFYGMISSLISIVLGHYSDGYIPSVSPHLFIANDQILFIFIAIFHMIALIEIYKPEKYERI